MARKWIMGVAGAVLAVVIGVLVMVPVLLETEWARTRIATALEEHTGRDTRVGDIEFSWLDGLVVNDVRLDQKPAHRGGGAGPLFVMDRLLVDVALLRLFERRLEIESLTAVRPEIVLIRDKAGRFNIADLLARPEKQQAPPPDLRADVDIRDAKLVYIDRQLGTQIVASDVDVDAVYDAGRLELRSDFELNGGRGALRAKVSLAETAPPFEVDLSIEGAKLGTELAPLGLFVPLFGEDPEAAHGTFGIELGDLSGRGFDLASLRRTLTARGRVALEDGSLASGPTAALVRSVRAATRGERDLVAIFQEGRAAGLHFDAFGGRFTIERGRVETRDLALASRDIDLAFSGWTSLTGELSYDVRSRALGELVEQTIAAARLPGIADLETSPLLRLAGTLRAPRVALDVDVDRLAREAAKRAAESAVEEGRERVEEEGKKLLEKRLRDFGL
jgi:uncharacterized protein involved in outer membrane biogenesis